MLNLNKDKFESDENEKKLLKQGIYHFYNSEFKEAINLFQTILSFNPSSIDARIYLSICYLAIRDYDFAEKELSIVEELNSNKPVLLFSLGNLNFKRGRYYQAIEFYDKLINQYPKFERAIFNKAISLIKTGSVVGVDKLLKDAIIINQDDYLYHFALASFLSFNKLFSEATIEYRISNDLNSDYVPIKINTGFNFVGLKMYDSAFQIFEQTKNSDLYASDSYFGIALVYYELHHYRLAIDNLSVSINLNPLDAKSYILRSNSFSELGELKLALDDYKKVLTFSPDSIKKYFLKNAKDRFHLTIEDYFKYIDIYIDDNRTYVMFL